MYHYTESGLPNIHLKNGFNLETFDGEEFVSFYNIDGLHKVIATALCKKVSLLTPDEFKFLRKELNYSTEQLSVVMRADIAKIESGDKPLFQVVDHQLRTLYLVLTNQNTSLVRDPFKVATQARMVFVADDDCNWSLQD